MIFEASRIPTNTLSISNTLPQPAQAWQPLNAKIQPPLTPTGGGAMLTVCCQGSTEQDFSHTSHTAVTPKQGPV